MLSSLLVLLLPILLWIVLAKMVDKGNRYIANSFNKISDSDDEAKPVDSDHCTDNPELMLIEFHTFIELLGDLMVRFCFYHSKSVYGRSVCGGEIATEIKSAVYSHSSRRFLFPFCSAVHMARCPSLSLAKVGESQDVDMYYAIEEQCAWMFKHHRSKIRAIAEKSNHDSLPTINYKDLFFVKIRSLLPGDDPRRIAPSVLKVYLFYVYRIVLSLSLSSSSSVCIERHASKNEMIREFWKLIQELGEEYIQIFGCRLDSKNLTLILSQTHACSSANNHHVPVVLCDIISAYSEGNYYQDITSNIFPPKKVKSIKFV